MNNVAYGLQKFNNLLTYLCLRFGHWLTLCTLNITYLHSYLHSNLLTYLLLTYLNSIDIRINIYATLSGDFQSPNYPTT